MEIPIQKDVSHDRKEGKEEKGRYQAAEDFPSTLLLDMRAQVIPEAQVEIDLQQEVEHEKE